MKPEDKSRLRRFWLEQGFYLRTMIVSLGLTVISIGWFKSNYGILQETEVQEAIENFPDRLRKDSLNTDPEISRYAAEALGRLEARTTDSVLRAVKCLNIDNNDSTTQQGKECGWIHEKDSITVDIRRRDQAICNLGMVRDRRSVLLLKYNNDGKPSIQKNIPEALELIQDKKCFF